MRSPPAIGLAAMLFPAARVACLAVTVAVVIPGGNKASNCNDATLIDPVDKVAKTPHAFPAITPEAAPRAIFGGIFTMGASTVTVTVAVVVLEPSKTACWRMKVPEESKTAAVFKAAGLENVTFPGLETLAMHR